MDFESGGDSVRYGWQRLYSAAGHHARAASGKRRSVDENLRMEAAVHAGAAVELMAKAILVSVDPRLICEERDGHHVVVDLLVQADRASAKPYSRKRKRTVSAGMAVDLAVRLCEHVRPHAQAAHAALGARNGAAHAAHIDDGALADQVTGGADFVLAGVDHFRRPRAEFLGCDLASTVERDVEEREVALRRAALRKVRQAKAWFDALVTPLPQESREALLAELWKRQPQYGDHSERYECPACGNSAWLIWNVDIDVEYEGPGDYSTQAYLDFRGLDCLFCNLQLNDLESEAIGIDPRGDPLGDFDDEVE